MAHGAEDSVTNDSVHVSSDEFPTKMFHPISRARIRVVATVARKLRDIPRASRMINLFFSNETLGFFLEETCDVSSRTTHKSFPAE
ncbi:hypothetical protein PX52LOC_03093 [Limnoglobus roseus]|uniref:Uncharacterized protein n=1 Tax=Limnoglobus roseus TaxID=2598579 RepID=A0A5C1AGB6_9BACT|nr:hypothetical protein PX52LOC_03093 [Limnoglobus roseus]